MTPTGFSIFMVKFAVLCFVGNRILRVYQKSETPPVPKRLLQIAGQVRKGNPPRRYWDTLRAEPMFDQHYRRMPHRMTCCVIPHRVNGEDVWQLRVGFRTTPNEEPSKFISIPVYSNGHIYDV